MDFINSQIKLLADKYAPFGMTEEKIRAMTQYAADGDNIPFKQVLFGARAVLSEMFNQPDKIYLDEAAEFFDISVEQVKAMIAKDAQEKADKSTVPLYNEYLQ